DFCMYFRFVLEAADAIEELASQLGQLAMLDGHDLQRKVEFLASELFIVRFLRYLELGRDRLAGLVANEQLVEAFELGVGQAQCRLDLDRLFGELCELSTIVRSADCDGSKITRFDRSLVCFKLAIL